MLNGERYDLGSDDGHDLKGSLIVLSKGTECFNHYHGVTRLHDTTISDADRAPQKLNNALVDAGHARPLINRLLGTINQFQEAGLLKKDERNFSFPRLNSLLRTAQAIDGPNAGDAHRVLKDRLTGDYRQDMP